MSAKSNSAGASRSYSGLSLRRGVGRCLSCSCVAGGAVHSLLTARCEWYWLRSATCQLQSERVAGRPVCTVIAIDVPR
ncbi:hypothetical protein OH77DRAFT_1424083 [Trametes cingulata]|nr:hypothetical protein OH77DRAFT_1424083 [Trametes cingulata]